MFRYVNNSTLVNEQGKVMEISGNIDVENRNIEIRNKHGRINQQWDLIYADVYPAEPKKGEFNKQFGLYVERPFYIVSEMSSNRYLQQLGIEAVIKTSNGQKAQRWYFD